MPFAGFTKVDLKVIQLRTSGVPVREIAKRIGVTRMTAYSYMSRVYRKLGFNDPCLLGIWAYQNGLNEPLGPETIEQRPCPEMPKPRRKRIRMGRSIGPMPIG